MNHVTTYEEAVAYSKEQWAAIHLDALASAEAGHLKIAMNAPHGYEDIELQGLFVTVVNRYIDWRKKRESSR